jgi:hypothetical protein
VESCRENSHGIVQWFLVFLLVALPLQGKKALSADVGKGCSEKQGMAGIMEMKY